MGHVFRSEEQAAAVDGLKRYLADKIDPLFRKEYRDSGLMPRDKLREIMKELVEFGMVSGAVSEARGGMGIDFLTLTMMYEEVCACSIDLSTVTLINTFSAKMLEALAPAHIQERYLPGMVKGELFGCMAFSEPDVGHTQQGGTPYGASHVAGASGNPLLAEAESRLALAQGRRLANIALKLNRP